MQIFKKSLAIFWGLVTKAGTL